MLISMIRVKLREVFDVKKVVCCCVSIVFMLISFLYGFDINYVSALTVNDDDYKYKPSMVADGTKQLFIYDDITYDFLKNYDIDDYYRVDGQKEAYELIVADAEDGNICGYNFPDSDDIFIRIYRDFTNNYWVLDYADSSRLYLHYRPDEGILNFKCTYIRQFKFVVENGEIKPHVLQFYGERDLDVLIETGVNSVMFPFFEKYLSFDVQPAVSVDMDLETLPSTFNIVAKNETDKYYDYMVYISENPSSIGVINSFNSSKYFMSSKQWCYQWLQDYSALNGSIEDYIADNIADGIKGADILDYTFGNGMYNSLFNAWGGAFDGAKEYFSVDDETMSFYQVSQTNCPVYRINPNDTKTHTISYSSLNLELGKTYYLNIIYTLVDFTAYSAMTTPIVDAGTGQQGNYPVFDTRNIAKYTVYDSYEFSVSNGVFSQDSNTLYSYSDLIKYTNPSNSVAKIESDDDEIIVSDNDSYDNSVSTEYINYGQIYHGCTFYNGTSGGSGGSGGLVEENIELKIYGVDDLDFELTQLSEPVNKFKQFMEVVFGFLPSEMVGLFILGISTCIICRILGR